MKWLAMTKSCVLFPIVGELFAVVDDVGFDERRLGKLLVLSTKICDRHPIDVSHSSTLWHAQRLVKGADLDAVAPQECRRYQFARAMNRRMRAVKLKPGNGRDTSGLTRSKERSDAPFES